METWMEILQRQVTTLKDSQRLGRWDRLDGYLSDSERPWKTANDPVIYIETNKIPLATANDWQWVSLEPKVAI